MAELKKRSEAVAMRKRSEAKSKEEPTTSALAGSARCGECGKTAALADATRRADGIYECPTCAAPLEVGRASEPEAPTIPNRKPDAERPPKATLPLPKVFCDECGAEWPRVDERPFPNCGHAEGFVDDPRKAKNWKPPAGHPRPPVDVEKLVDAIGEESAKVFDAAKKTLDAKRAPPEGGSLASPSNPFLVSAPSVGERLNVELGKMVFRLGDYGVNLTVGPFSASVVVPEGADRVVEGAKVLKDLKALADTSFLEQLTWYLSRLGVIEKKLGGG